MKPKDYLFAILAGFSTVALGIVQMALAWSEFGKTHESIVLYAYPFIPAILLFFLLKHEQEKYLSIKIGIYLIVSFCLQWLCFEQLDLFHVLFSLVTGRERGTRGEAGIITAMNAIDLLFKGSVIILVAYLSERKRNKSLEPT